MPSQKTFDENPREFVLEMVDEESYSAYEMLKLCVNFMSHDDVRKMLDNNELAPRFKKWEDFIDNLDDGEHDVAMLRIDIDNDNFDPDSGDTDDYLHETIVEESFANGNIEQCKEQCEEYGLDYDELETRLQALATIRKGLEDANTHKDY